MGDSPSGNGQNPTRAQSHDPVRVDHGPNAVKIRNLDEKYAGFNDDRVRARHSDLKSALYQYTNGTNGRRNAA
jgi:hypothetical protein